MNLDFDKELKVCEARKKAGVQFDFGYEVALRRLKRLRELAESMTTKDGALREALQSTVLEFRGLLNMPVAGNVAGFPAIQLLPGQAARIVAADHCPGYQWNVGDIVRRGSSSLIFNETRNGDNSWKHLESCRDIRVELV